MLTVSRAPVIDLESKKTNYHIPKGISFYAQYQITHMEQSYFCVTYAAHSNINSVIESKYTKTYKPTDYIKKMNRVGIFVKRSAGYFNKKRDKFFVLFKNGQIHYRANTLHHSNYYWQVDVLDSARYRNGVLISKVSGYISYADPIPTIPPDNHLSYPYRDAKVERVKLFVNKKYLSFRGEVFYRDY